MNSRILVKVSANKSVIQFRLIGPDTEARKDFCIGRGSFETLKNTGTVLVQEGASIAELWKNDGSDTVSIRFSWLSYPGSNHVIDWEQTVKLPYQRLCNFVMESAGENGPAEWAALSVEPGKCPRFVFRGKENLHAALGNKTVRRKLVRFLRDNFKWQGADEIRFYNDFVPCSFFFREFTNGRPGMCGGLILHGQENLKEAYYSIHT